MAHFLTDVDTDVTSYRISDTILISSTKMMSWTNPQFRAVVNNPLSEEKGSKVENQLHIRFRRPVCTSFRRAVDLLILPPLLLSPKQWYE